MGTTTVQILNGFKTVIEALTPAGQVTEDDRYEVAIGTRIASTRNRTWFLLAMPGRRIPTGGRTGRDWETVITLEGQYQDGPAELGEQTAYATAVADAEQIIAALDDWMAVEGNVGNVEIDMGQITDQNDGTLQVSRSMRVEYVRA